MKAHKRLPAGYVFRSKLILMLAERLQTTAPTIVRWKQHFLASGLDGLDTYHLGQTVSVLTPVVRARNLSATRKPSDGSTHWSCHKRGFCVDEKTAIQALDRLDPVLPLSPGRARSQHTI